MPGPVLHLGATILCSHGGQATPATPFPRVTVGGQPVVTIASPYLVAGCPFVTPGGNGPCVTANYVTSATRVLAGGTPVLLQDSMAVCAPTGTPLVPVVVQPRVVGS
ncbi:hypothetical protein ACFB49_00490 [Sphingomonas sp. DBB INV C78]|uniref:hypothetical protein n=1 Tax=Sphingomonas sp. DBB INV C78 TaxID=3349434 RepID=UPI0036D39876